MSAKVNKSTILHEGRVFTILEENVTLANGVTTDLDIIHHPGASAIVPFIENNTVIMIKQYRHALGSFIWEIPAGTLNSNETPIECAKRELTEETGFSGNIWNKLGEITPVPGYSDERIHVFLTKELVSARQNLDKDEILDVHEIKIDDAIKMIFDGLIQDCKSIFGLFMATNFLKK